MKFTVKESKLGSKGSFATENIKKGETIKLLTGEVLSRDEINKRIVEEKEGNDDPLQIGDELFIDLDEPSRLFNHSCDPNTGIRGENELFAIRDISKGEEITFDYSTTVGSIIRGNINPWTMDCNCKSKNCRERIGHVLTIPKKRLEEYAEMGALPDFIKKQSSSSID